jgi:hypothetical protein
VDIDTLTLTTARAESSYGQPVLVIGSEVYGPGDMTPAGVSSAELLRQWVARFRGPAVNGAARGASYQCDLCGFGAANRAQILAHCAAAHPDDQPDDLVTVRRGALLMTLADALAHELARALFDLCAALRTNYTPATIVSEGYLAAGLAALRAAGYDPDAPWPDQPQGTGQQ